MTGAVILVVAVVAAVALGVMLGRNAEREVKFPYVYECSECGYIIQSDDLEACTRLQKIHQQLRGHT